MKNPHHQIRTNSLPVFVVLLVIVSLLSACMPASPTTTPTRIASPTATSLPETPSPTSTLRPSPTPTLPPLGTEGNPITLGFVIDPKETQAIDGAQEIALILADETGYFIKYLIYPDFESLSGAILTGDVHFSWLGPLEYLDLHQAGAVEVVLMTNHLGVYAYGVQFMAHAERGFNSYFDPELNQSAQEANIALQQFSGTRPCYLHNESLPGYLVPHGLLANGSIPTLDPVFVYTYTAVIRALYIQGICDFGVSYALTGDPRSAGDILQSLPDAETQIPVIWQSEGIIPNTNLSASTALPLAIQHRIQEAFLDLPESPEGLDLLSQALNYDVEALKIVDDGFYLPLRTALASLDLNLQELIFEKPTP